MDKISPAHNNYSMPPGLFEYLLIVCPAMEVYKKIMEEKWKFYRNYRYAKAIKTRPQIVLANFLAWENMEDTIIRRLQSMTKEQRSFGVTLNNYSGFPSDTVYIRVQDTSSFKEINARLQALSPYIKQANAASAKMIQYPSINLAAQLPPEVYNEAIRDYSEKDFTASFSVTELVLLRRQHPYDKSKELGVFRLQPMKEQLNQVL